MIGEQRRRDSSRRGEQREDPIIERHEIVLDDEQMLRFLLGTILLNGFMGQA